MNETTAKIDAKLTALGLAMTAEFVPASRFKDDEWKRGAVNFTVTIVKGERAIYSGPYAYGVGNLPRYRSDRATKMLWAPMVTAAIERGKWPRTGLDRDPPSFSQDPNDKAPAPLLRDVMYSLLCDASALDHPDFESWAGDYGYDTDSRKAEQTYRACVDIGLKLRATLGDAVLAELQELFQDY